MKHVESLINSLSKQSFVNNDDRLEKFCKTAIDTSNSFALIKKKYACGNQMPYMTKSLSKEIITRTRLRLYKLTNVCSKTARISALALSW